MTTLPEMVSPGTAPGGTPPAAPAPAVRDSITVSGRTLRIASITDEEWQPAAFPQNPAAFVAEARRTVRADLLTFAEPLGSTQPALPDYYFEWDNAAVVPLANFKAWWESLPQEARKNVRRSERRGVTVRRVEFDDHLVAGIQKIYDETPIRQGRRFWHYQKDLATIKRENSSYLERCDFLGAFFQDELIGFVKIVYVGRVARIMQILSMNAHFDKRPPNALLAKSVEWCCQKGMSYFVYGKYIYGNKRNSPITEFKRRTGFEELKFRRYYVPLTLRGKIALRLRLHLGLKNLLPERVTDFLLDVRSKIYARTLPQPASAPASTRAESEE